MDTDRTRLRWNGWGPVALNDTLAGREDVWAWLAGELGMPSLLATPARELSEIAVPPSRLALADKEKFARLLGGDQLRDDDYERAFHARGKSYHDLLHLRAGNMGVVPDAVLYPRSTVDVADVLAFASERGIAVVPYGGGTSVVGGATANRGKFDAAVTVDLSLMNRLLAVDRVSFTAAAEGGIYGPALEAELKAKGLTLGHYPQSFEFSTLGGWIAHRGSGQQSGRYGRAENWLIGGILATPRGILTARDFPASAAGPHLADLMAGSEGAFGIVTEARFRVRPIPERRLYAGFLFPDFDSGASAIREAKQAGVEAAMLRLSDTSETRFFRAYSRVGKSRGLRDWLTGAFLKARGFSESACALIAGFEGTESEIVSSYQRFRVIAKRRGAMTLGEGPGKRWYEGRFHGPYLRDPMMNHGVGVDTLETAASWSKLMPLYHAARSALEESIVANGPRKGARGIVMCHISHSYSDGASLYFTYIFPRALDDEIGQWRAIKTAASDAIAANGGTISHHHGVGEDHLPWIAQEKGELGIEILRAIKKTLNPNGILNPGKLIPG